jgi:hypothetical protein
MPRYIYLLPNLLIIVLTIMAIQIFSHWVPYFVGMVFDFHLTEEKIKIYQLLAP